MIFEGPPSIPSPCSLEIAALAIGQGARAHFVHELGIGQREVEPESSVGRKLTELRRQLWRNRAAPGEVSTPTEPAASPAWPRAPEQGSVPAAASSCSPSGGAPAQRRRARQAIEALSATMSQRELEATLGLSAAYLSKVRHGKEAPSAPLVALLSLLAARPARIEEVERVWATGRLSPRVVGTNISRVDLKVDSDVAVAG